MKKSEQKHVPVLLNEVLENLKPIKGKYVDATLGFGGHSLAIVKAGGELLGIDWDPKVLKLTKKHFLENCPNASWKLVEGNFANLGEIIKKEKFVPIAGIIFDLGISRWHYKEAKRGFSFEDTCLDMRISPNLPETALDVINYYSQDELYQIFTKIAQEKLAEPIARALVHARSLKKIDSAEELSKLVADVYFKSNLKTKNNPATKVFLALRTVVNKELENIVSGLKEAFLNLDSKGKLLVITFNSNEDRLVKTFFKKQVKGGLAETKKLVFPNWQEIKQNPLSRSAKLRILVKF